MTATVSTMNPIDESPMKEQEHDLLPTLTHVVGTAPFTDSWFQWAKAIWTKLSLDAESSSTNSLDERIKIVCLSDTHGHHRRIDMPPGDILLHAGDYTLHGDRAHAEDFDDWLSTLSYTYKIVVHGNHEENASWKKEAKDILSHAILLHQEQVEVAVQRKDGTLRTVKIFGTMFNWPCKGHNPYFDQIPLDTDIVVSHCPARGCVDEGRGCDSLRSCILDRVQPKVVLSGHQHGGRGVVMRGETTFVNAANAAKNHQVTKQPIVLYL